MRLMKFKKFTTIKESSSDVGLNRILDKISKRLDITDGEKKFLDNFGNVEDRDYVMISKDSMVNVVNNLIKSGRVVICNLHDRDGIVGLEISSIVNDFQDEKCKIHLKNKSVFTVEDRFLYSIIYDIDESLYSLEYHSEYYEKVPISND